MKKVLVFAVAAVLCFTFAAAVQAKVLYIVKIDKGEMTTDNNGCEVALVEDHALVKGGLAMMVTPAKDNKGWWVGEFGPRRGVWEGFDMIKIGFFNPTAKPLTLSFLIKPPDIKSYDERVDQTIVVRPGATEMEIDLVGMCSNGGQKVDLTKRMSQWAICGGGTDVFYITKITCENEGDGKEEKKGKK